MTLLFFDGFDDISLITDLERRWGAYYVYSTYPYVINNDGRFGGKCIQTAPNSGSYISKKFSPTTGKMIFGFALKRSSTGATDSVNGTINVLTVDDTISGCLYLSSSGALQWKAGSASLPNSDVSDTIIDADTWYYIELAHLPGKNDDGSIEVKVNGNTVILMENASTIYTSWPDEISSIRIYGASVGNVYYDDVYILDTNGTVNNSFLGNVRVTQIKPNGAGNYTQFTASSGSNYECVNDVNWEGTDYNQSATTDQIDTFTFEGMSSDLGVIKGIQICNGCKRYIESDTSKIKHVIRKSSTDYISSAEDITDDVKGALKIYETDPEDSTAWTKTKIDATEFGYQSNLT